MYYMNLLIDRWLPQQRRAGLPPALSPSLPLSSLPFLVLTYFPLTSIDLHAFLFANSLDFSIT